MLPVVAIQAQVLPITAVRRIVIVVMIFVMHGQLVQVLARKLAPAPGAHVRMQFERLLAIPAHARVRLLTRLGHDVIEPGGIDGSARGFTWAMSSSRQSAPPRP